jgi:hypothetical protein
MSTGSSGWTPPAVCADAIEHAQAQAAASAVGVTLIRCDRILKSSLKLKCVAIVKRGPDIASGL